MVDADLKIIIAVTVLVCCYTFLEEDANKPHDSTFLASDNATELAEQELKPVDQKETMNYNVYLGEWKYVQKGAYNWLKQDQGRFYLVLSPVDANLTLTVVMVLFDGEWQDDPTRLAVFRHSLFSNSSAVLGSPADFYNTRYDLSNGRSYTVSETHGQLSIASGRSRLEVDGEVSFPDQGITLEFRGSQVLHKDFLEKVVLYFVIYVGLAMTAFVAFSFHISYVSGNQYRAKGISMSFLFMNASIDMVLAIWHFGFIFTNLFSVDLLSIPSFASFVLCLITIDPLATSVWKAQNPTADYSGVRKFKTRFFFVVVTTACAFYVLSQWYLLTIFILHLFFVPQIIMNISENYRHSIKTEVYTMIAISRFGVIVYYFGFSDSFLVWQPKFDYVALIGCSMAVQVGVLALQTRYGARFFLPRSMYSGAYSYYRTKAEEDLLEQTDCVICLNPLNLGSRPREEGNLSKTVHTPCNHRYHEDCLQSWIRINPQCPTCRRDIPDISDEV